MIRQPDRDRCGTDHGSARRPWLSCRKGEILVRFPGPRSRVGTVGLCQRRRQRRQGPLSGFTGSGGPVGDGTRQAWATKPTRIARKCLGCNERPLMCRLLAFPALRKLRDRKDFAEYRPPAWCLQVHRVHKCMEFTCAWSSQVVAFANYTNPDRTGASCPNFLVF